MSRHTDVPPFARRHAPMHPAVHAKIMAEMEADLAGDMPRRRVVPAAEKDTIGWVDNRGHVQFHKDHEDCVHRRGREMMFLYAMTAFCVVMGLGLAWCIV